MAFPIENLLSPNLTNMMITLVIPFLIIFTVLLFALKKTRVLGDSNSVYVIISLGLTVMIYAVNPGNVFQFLASYLFQIGVAGTIIALGGVVIFLFLALIRKSASIAESLKSGEQKLTDLRKNEERLLKQIHGGAIFGPSTGTKMEKLKQLKDTEDEIKRLELYLRAKRRI